VSRFHDSTKRATERSKVRSSSSEKKQAGISRAAWWKEMHSQQMPFLLQGS
jgi:hypothetical protein